MRPFSPRVAVLFVAIAACASCGITPRISLDEARLAEGPMLIRRGEGYVLRYRFSPPEDDMQFAASVFAHRTDDAGYYYFAGVLQSTALERGRPVERRLANDGLDDLAAAGRVFWLDPDGTAHPIPVIERDAR